MKKEQERVSSLVHSIIDHYQDQFISHIQHDQNDDAIAIGDEILEWTKDVDAETIFYYIQEDLEELYRSKRTRRGKNKRRLE